MRGFVLCFVFALRKEAGGFSRCERQASRGAPCRAVIAAAPGVPVRRKWEALTVSDELSTGEQGTQIVPGASRQLSHCG